MKLTFAICLAFSVGMFTMMQSPLQSAVEILAAIR